MAAGRSTIESALFSDDTRYMIEALRALGFKVESDETQRRIEVEGRAGEIPASSADLFVGNAGTAMRFILGFLTLGRGRFRLDGSPRMRERPIGELLDALASLGVQAKSERGDRCPPVVIEPPPGFAGGAAEIDAGVSSQFVSALLMPAPLWKNGLRLKVTGAVARPFIDMTLAIMKRCGASSSVEGDEIVIPGGQRYQAHDFTVEPDASSASYFAAAAALCGGSVRIAGLRPDSVQGDIGFLKVLQKMGAHVIWHGHGVEVRSDRELAGVDVDLAAMPDMFATLAAIAPFASSPTTIRGVGFIRHHESDRLRAIATELAKLGAKVTRDRRWNRDRAVEASSRNNRQLGRPSDRDELRGRRVEAPGRANPESRLRLQDLPRFLRASKRTRRLALVCVALTPCSPSSIPC